MSLSKNVFDVSQFYFLNRWFRQYKIFEMNLNKEYISNAFVKVLKTKNPNIAIRVLVVPPVPRLRENQRHYDFLLDKMSFKIEGSAIILLLKVLLFILLINFSK